MKTVRAKASNQEWVMPRPTRGQAVVFYYRGNTSQSNADVGFISAVGQRAVDINYRGQGYKECLHRDDPRLVSNPDIKQDIDGVWEFTKESKIIDDRLHDLEIRLAELESKLK